jgi:hypothetical protein
VTEEHAPTETELVEAVHEAIDASTRREHEQASAYEMMKEAIAVHRRTLNRQRFVGILLIAGLILVGYWTYNTQNDVQAIDARTTHNSAVLRCVAASEAALAADIRVLVHSQGRAPEGSYHIPADCSRIR